MKKITTLLMMLMLMSTALWADETVTVSANSSDISEGLDLKVVAKLFAEAKNLEEFETMLNNPDSAFCNLDLNGDGQVDYLRVVETGEGSKRLIVLQAVLAKDIYQDVASIYVEKNEKDEVSVQVVGDEYVYGTNYIIEPVYIYRPVIYDWFWSDAWYAWHSPWYWGYYPGWWYVHSCWAYDRYWHHCYAYHHHHHCCSFRPGREVRHGYHEMHRSVARRDMAASHPERSFSQRNSGMSNAREIRRSSSTQARQAAGVTSGGGVRHAQSAAASSRTYGSQNTAAARSASAPVTSRSAAASTSRSAAAASTSRSASASTTRSAAAPSVSRSAGSTQVSSRSAVTTSAARNTNVSATRSVNTSVPSRSVSTSAPSRSSYSGNSSSYSGSSRSSSFSGGGGYSGGTSRSSSFSGGGASRGGGGGAVRR